MQLLGSRRRRAAWAAATDLVRFPYTKEWSSEDVQVMAGLIVNAMVSIVESILEAPKSPAAEEELRRIAEKQLRMSLWPLRRGAAGQAADYKGLTPFGPPNFSGSQENSQHVKRLRRTE